MAFVKLSSQQRMPAPRAAASLEEKYYSISDLAREFDVSLRALRFYEDRDLLHPQRRGLARLYTQIDRVRLQMILKGKKLGFTLSEIRDMLAAKADPERNDISLDLNSEQVLSQIGHLERQRGDLDHAIGELKATQSRLAAASSHQAA